VGLTLRPGTIQVLQPYQFPANNNSEYLWHLQRGQSGQPLPPEHHDAYIEAFTIFSSSLSHKLPPSIGFAHLVLVLQQVLLHMLYRHFLCTYTAKSLRANLHDLNLHPVFYQSDLCGYLIGDILYYFGTSLGTFKLFQLELHPPSPTILAYVDT
jgi:hypothetical protein